MHKALPVNICVTLGPNKTLRMTATGYIDSGVLTIPPVRINANLPEIPEGEISLECAKSIVNSDLPDSDKKEAVLRFLEQQDARVSGG